MNAPFKFFLITDPHFFKNSIGAYGDGYRELMKSEQKCFAETEAMNREIIKYLKNTDEADVILIAGDLSFNGEKESHEEYSRLLKELKASGKKIYVVTASHDIEPHPFCFPGSAGKEPCEGIKFSELSEYYHEFGYDDAIAFNREHMSYVAQLTDGIRLLVLCNDTKDGRSLPYDDDFKAWIKQQLRRAECENQMMIAMEHYPILPGQPILSFFPDARQPNAAEVIELLADNGCHLCFTGHMHNQSINTVTTKKGNKFYDVCTGSLIGCPAFMRLCTVIDDDTVEIKSIPVPEFDFPGKTTSCEEYLQAQFDGMIINLITGMRDNPALTLKKLTMKETDMSKRILVAFGKFLCNNTLGNVAKFFGIKAEKEAQDVKLIDFLTDTVRFTFCGNQPFTEDNPVGKTFLKILKRLSPVLKILNKKLHDSQGDAVDIYEIMKHTLGNYGIDDNNATIKLS